MKVHYFQRYHSKENVATANTMLLLSRLYSYSPEKFFKLLKSEIFSDIFEPEMTFRMQERNKNSVPDATITQEGFKIVVEAKMTDWFYEDQLIRHLSAFGDEKHKVLVTIAPKFMEEGKKRSFEKQLKEYNESQKYRVIHLNTTFEELTNMIQSVLVDKDDEMKNVIEDYIEFCYQSELILVPDSWKYMRIQLAGTTFDFNVKESVYYDNAERGFRMHDYLGLYKNKSVRAVGKIVARITAVETEGQIEFEAEFGELTETRKEKIYKAMNDSVSYGYDLRSTKHRYFFVDQFYETDFRKQSPRASMGTRIFDLTKILETNEVPDVKTIAELLRNKTWQ